jgi:hypothetical protein
LFGIIVQEQAFALLVVVVLSLPCSRFVGKDIVVVVLVVVPLGEDGSQRRTPHLLLLLLLLLLGWWLPRPLCRSSFSGMNDRLS